jgi:signal transduction histidine kinase
MKKLKFKVFITIFLLLSLFLVVLFVSNTTKNYLDKQKVIDETLRRASMDNIRPRNNFFNDKFPLPNNNDNNNVRKVYVDFTIYTVILNDSGEYEKVISNTDSSTLDEEAIKKIANDIIDNHTSDYYVGNLFTTKYSYAFSKNNTLIIMDNTNTNKSLINQLVSSSILFIILETISFIITHYISLWIVNPVKKSFVKQKQFISDASHELKTPLSVITASCDAYFNDKNDKWIYNVKSESERMSKLVTELLDLASIEEKEVEKSDINLSDIVESSVLTYESVFFEKKINLKYKITDDIHLKCNEDQIKELMSILIDNSIKHCSREGKVNINLIREDKSIILEVKNTGDAIKKEDEERIFERFYKVDSSRNRNSNNYGLGLAIAKSIVENHDGNIKAFSKNGVTTFKVTWNQ